MIMSGTALHVTSLLGISGESSCMVSTQRGRPGTQPTRPLGSLILHPAMCRVLVLLFQCGSRPWSGTLWSCNPACFPQEGMVRVIKKHKAPVVSLGHESERSEWDIAAISRTVMLMGIFKKYVRKAAWLPYHLPPRPLPRPRPFPQLPPRPPPLPPLPNPPSRRSSAGGGPSRIRWFRSS